MHTKSFVANGIDYEIVVRPNNDGWAIWYVELTAAGDEEDLPDGYEHIFGELDVGFDEAPEVFAQAERDALEEAGKLESYLRS